MAALDIEFTFPTKGSETCQFSYDTINQITGTGIERTMPKRLEYKLAIDFDTFTTRCHTDFVAIRDFYLGQAKGSENSFWYRCPVEYKINSFDVEAYQATGDTYVVGKYGILSYTGTGTDFQAMVVYHIGVNSPASAQRLGFKTVLRVDGSTLSIRNLTTNAQVTGFTLGTTTNTRGIVTLPAGSNLSHNYRWTGEYLHRMRFDSDLNATPVRGQSELFEISGLRMVEKPHTAHRAFADPNWFLNITRIFKPPAQPNYSINYAYFNKEDTLSINKELITRDETEVTATFTTENTIVHHTVKQYYFTWFNAMRGSLLTFEMLDQQARMSDVISFTTEAWKTCEKFVFNSFDITLKGEKSFVLVVQPPNTSPFYLNGTNPTTTVQSINPQNASDPTIVNQAFYVNHGATTPTNPSGNGTYDLTVFGTNPAVFRNNALYTNGAITTALGVNLRVHALIRGNDGKYYFIARTLATLAAPFNSRVVLIELDLATGTATNKYISPVENFITIVTSNQPQEPSLGRVIRNGKYAQYEFWTTSATVSSIGNQDVNCFYVDVNGAVQRLVFSNASLTANATGKYRTSTASNSLFPIPFHYDGVNTYYCFDHAPGVQDTYSATVSGTNFVVSPYHSSYAWGQTTQNISSFTTNAALIPSLRFPMHDKTPVGNATPVIGTQYPIGIKFNSIPTSAATGAWKTMGFSVNIGTNTLATGKTNVRYWQGDVTYPSQLSLDVRNIVAVNASRFRGLQAHVMPQSGRIFMSYAIDGIAATTADNTNPPTTGTYGYIGHHYGYAVVASRTDSTILDSFVKTGLGTSVNSDFTSTTATTQPAANTTRRVLGASIIHVNDNPSGDIIGELMTEGSGDSTRQVFFKRRGTNHFIIINSVIQNTGTTVAFRSTNFMWIPEYASWLHIRYIDTSNIYMYFITPS
jgi:hypothetical protein